MSANPEDDLRTEAEAFIEKIKTLAIQTTHALPPCKLCGKAMAEHKLFVVSVPLERQRTPQEQRAFAE